MYCAYFKNSVQCPCMGEQLLVSQEACSFPGACCVPAWVNSYWFLKKPVVSLELVVSLHG